MTDDQRDRDAFIEETAERAASRYAGKLDPAIIEEMRTFLEDLLATHPVASTLADRVRPRRTPERSGDVAKDGEVSTPNDARRKKGSRG